MPTIKSFFSAIKDHPVLFGYILAAILITASFNGCEPKTDSILNADRQITRLELEAEVQLYLARVRTRLTELDNKERILRTLTEFTALTLQTGQLNPTGISTLLLTLLGGGMIGKYAGEKTARRSGHTDNQDRAPPQPVRPH